MKPSTNSDAQAAVERHPLPPFLPEGARLLMLGSFPPQRRRWSMEFFYPNLQNDMWRIVGLLAAGDKSHFLAPGGRQFDRERIEAFCRERGLALYDTAEEVVRLRDNASDNFLQVVRRTDIEALLARIPRCRTIVVTGQKAADTLCEATGCAQPPVGGRTTLRLADREMTLWRMPSSSRAYPRPVEWKAEFYRRPFVEAGILAGEETPRP
ncbi:uracil-DNA glycosylase family protein [uncultured Alistipes sp.]|uniref:uracil-DNA glycosylase family protein n=1 Tax=uncultured Alistipes sp. TaxID=538949 RepID=UPI0026081198|nr:uracil-DNA glycosylase family protein [uncultured Alistipes sp.]